MNEPAATDREELKPDSPRRRRWIKRIGWVLAIIAAPIVLATLVVNTQFGKRFIADQIASYAPVSGLKFEVGELEGDVFREAILRDVTVSDPKGVFLTIPLVELDWRPLNWIFSGLDIRTFAARDGELSRIPELLPGDPDAPILPDFDIRVDHLEIDHLTILPGVATKQSERVDVLARADIRDGLVSLKLDGSLGQADKIAALLHAEPDGDRFELELNYDAPADGVIAGLVGAEAGYHARLSGDGSWKDWLGKGAVERGDARFATFQLTNKEGQYRFSGEAYTSEVTEGILRRALGKRTGFVIDGRLEDSRFDGKVFISGEGVRGRGQGEIDLADNLFDDFNLSGESLDPQLFGSDIRLGTASLKASLDGPFRDATIEHELTVARLEIGEINVVRLQQAGIGQLEGGVFRIPLALSIEKIETGSTFADSQFVAGRITGEVTYADGLIRSEALQATFPKLKGKFTLLANPSAGSISLAGPASASGIPIGGVGNAQANAKIAFTLGNGEPWFVRMDIAGDINDLENSAGRQILGESVSIRTQLESAGGGPIFLSNLEAQSEEISLRGNANWSGSSLALSAAGKHARFGPFNLDGAIEDGAPDLVLNLSSPFPAASIENVRLAIAPAGEGYRIDTMGNSVLGEFSGVLGLDLASGNEATTLSVDSFLVWRTSVDGLIYFEENGIRGKLALAGGGMDGSIKFAPDSDGQKISADLSARNAVFGGETAVSLGQATIALDGIFSEDSTRIRSDLNGRGLRYGRLFLGRVAARANIEDGKGEIAASMVGRRGGRFRLELDGKVSPGRISAAVRGNYAETAISMPRSAVLSRLDDASWQVRPTLINFGEGQARFSGTFGSELTEMEFRLVRVPLALADLAVDDLGASGSVSGRLQYRQAPGDAPRGTAKIKVNALTRSGVLLASPPIDVDLTASLDAEEFEAKALVRSDNQRIGWLDAQVLGMPRDGTLFERMQQGNLRASMQYDGAAEQLWRLGAIDTFDISGPVKIQARAGTTLANPRVTGSLTSDNLRVRSVISGTDITQISVRGQFKGPRLSLRRFAGTIGNGGTIEGSGFVDLADLGPGQGPKLDLRAAAKNAQLIDARGLRATITGPLRIVSSGVGGTIAGRVEVDRASWQLGRAAEDVSLPEITTTEINLPAEIAPQTRGAAPWRYLVDAKARNRIDVDGLGLDSEWQGDIIIRGTTADPRIGGDVRVIRGTYTFADSSFELTRGRITFDENVPIDPRIDILAEASRSGLNVQVSVRGNALSPEIAFSSEPPLPEEEILARLLFGGPVTELSPTDALQLGAALASLRSGGGMDPINRLRGQIGLDRLRIVGADPALGHGAGVMLGENLSRRFYVELVTDGKGYSATELEFRVTSWLSLLGSVSTLGRESVVVEVSRDY